MQVNEDGLQKRENFIVSQNFIPHVVDDPVDYQLHSGVEEEKRDVLGRIKLVDSRFNYFLPLSLYLWNIEADKSFLVQNCIEQVEKALLLLDKHVNLLPLLFQISGGRLFPAKSRRSSFRSPLGSESFARTALL